MNRRSFYLIVLCCLLFPQIHAQHQLASWYLNKAQVFYEDSSDYNLTIQFGHQAFQLAQNDQNDELVMKAALVLGMGYTIASLETDSAYFYFQKAMKIAKRQSNNNAINKIQLERSFLHVFGGETEDATHDLFKLLKYFNSIQDTFYMAKSHYYLAKLYSNQNNYKEAIKHIEKACLYFNRSEKKVFESYSFIKLGHYYSMLGNYKQSENLLKQVFLRFPNVKYGYGKYKYLDALSILYGNMGNYKRSLNICKDALVITKKLNLIIETEDILRRIGINYMLLTNMPMALSYADTIAQYALLDQTNAANLYNYEFLSEIYNQAGNYKQAYKYRMKYEQSKEKVISIHTNRLIEELKAKYETELKDKQLNEKSKKIKMLNVERKMTNYKYSLIMISLIAIGLILFVFSYIKISSAKREKVNLSHQKEISELEFQRKIKALEIQILYAQMSPHFVFNCLSAIQHLFLSRDEVTANAKLSSFSRLLRLSIDHVKKDYVSIQSELLFLNHYIDLEQLQFSEEFDYKLINDCVENIENLIIPSMIIQPYVENAINHGLKNKSYNRQLTIHVKELSDTIEIEVTDNGIGRTKAYVFKSNSIGNHHSRGLDLVNEKIKVLKELTGETIDIETIDLYDTKNQAAGTCVRLSFPKIIH